MGRQEEHLALADGDVARAAVLPDPQHHVAAELVEELVARVVVEVGALVGAADDGDDEVALVPDLGVADRRAQLLAVLLDPAGEVDRATSTPCRTAAAGHRLDLDRQVRVGQLVDGHGGAGRTGLGREVLARRPRCSPRSRPSSRGTSSRRRGRPATAPTSASRAAMLSSTARVWTRMSRVTVPSSSMSAPAIVPSGRRGRSCPRRTPTPPSGGGEGRHPAAASARGRPRSGRTSTPSGGWPRWCRHPGAGRAGRR